MLPLQCKKAENARVVCVFVQHASDTWSIAKWNYQKGGVLLGACLRGKLHIRRSSISEDGRYLGYFVTKDFRGREETLKKPWPKTYFAISKLPWLTALAAWDVSGCHFYGSKFGSREITVNASVMEEAPFHGKSKIKLNIVPSKYSEDRVIGPFVAEGTWRQLNRDVLESFKVQFGIQEIQVEILSKLGAHHGIELLRIAKSLSHWRKVGDSLEEVADSYFLKYHDRWITLEDAVWADWTEAGELLVATDKGMIEVRSFCPKEESTKIIWNYDCNSIDWNPKRSSSRAHSW